MFPKWNLDWERLQKYATIARKVISVLRSLHASSSPTAIEEHFEKKKLREEKEEVQEEPGVLMKHSMGGMRGNVYSAPEVVLGRNQFFGLLEHHIFCTRCRTVGMKVEHHSGGNGTIIFYLKCLHCPQKYSFNSHNPKIIKESLPENQVMQVFENMMMGVSHRTHQVIHPHPIAKGKYREIEEKIAPEIIELHENNLKHYRDQISNSTSQFLVALDGSWATRRNSSSFRLIVMAEIDEKWKIIYAIPLTKGRLKDQYQGSSQSMEPHCVSMLLEEMKKDGIHERLQEICTDQNPKVVKMLKEFREKNKLKFNIGADQSHLLKNIFNRIDFKNLSRKLQKQAKKWVHSTIYEAKKMPDVEDRKVYLKEWFGEGMINHFTTQKCDKKCRCKERGYWVFVDPKDTQFERLQKISSRLVDISESIAVTQGNTSVVEAFNSMFVQTHHKEHVQMSMWNAQVALQSLIWNLGYHLTAKLFAEKMGTTVPNRNVLLDRDSRRKRGRKFFQKNKKKINTRAKRNLKLSQKLQKEHQTKNKKRKK